MSKYSEAGKGSTTKLKQKKKFDDNWDRIDFSKKEEYFDSDDESNSWDEDRIDIISQNGNNGTHYFDE